MKTNIEYWSVIDFFMSLDFNDFLRLMSAVLIFLLIVQGLDLIFGLGVNKYLFIFFCIAFAFTMGSIYHNITTSKDKEFNESVTIKLKELDGVLNGKIERQGMTKELIACQEALINLRKELGIED